MTSRAGLKGLNGEVSHAGA